ncbi:TPA: DUF551 domain-containing protein [Klebsiella variicola]
MTNNQLNRERLEKIKSWRETYGAGSNVMLPAEEAEELARIALAAMESEPVAWTWHYREQWHVTNDKCRAEFVAKDGDVAVLPLYRHAQPAPVVPKSISVRQAISALESAGAVTTIGQAYKMGWNACRAAMLAAAPQSPGSEPATAPGKWIPVSEQMPPSRHEVLVGRWWGEKPRWCCKWATYIPGHPDAQSSGWLIPGASWTPTHWMPLPASPQEVNHG